MTAIAELIADLAGLVVPTACLGCDRPDRELCDACRARLRRLAARARTRTEPTTELGVQTPAGPGTVPLYAAADYIGIARACIVAYKHQARIRLARPLGALLAAPLEAALAAAAGAHPHRPVVIVGVPSRRARVRERGYRHVETLVAAALRAPRRAAPAPPPPVIRRRALAPAPGRTGQVGLSSQARVRNARRLRVRRRDLPALAGRSVVVVDDIVTTGATMAAACQRLMHAGVQVRAAVAICAVERRDTRGPATGAAGEEAGKP